MSLRFHIAWIMMTAAAFTFKVDAAPSFYTRCLETLSKALKLNLPDRMEADVDNDSTWHYAGKPLRVRTNAYGDVSHIGYKLFDSQWAMAHDARPLLDFLERYALEQDVRREGVDKAEEASRKRVTFIEGNVSMLRNIDPETNCTVSEIERRSYTVAWEKDSLKVRLQVSADYQLFTGANAVELEQIFERDVRRTRLDPTEGTLPKEWLQGRRSHADSLFIVSNGCYLSDQIRSDLYLYEQDGTLFLVKDVSRPLQSVNNILLTGHSEKDIPLKLTVDKYGYNKSQIEITLQQLLAYFRMENCKVYLGIKDRTSDYITATLFAVNLKMAYNHTVSLKFPLKILDGAEMKVEGTIYTYTPLQNITEKFFINNIKQN